MNHINDLTTESDKKNLLQIHKNNVLALEKIKEFLVLIDKIDNSINQKIQKHIQDLNYLNISFGENIERFKHIHNNLSN